MIHTVLHTMFDFMRESPPTDPAKRQRMQMLRDLFTNKPHYIVSEDIVRSSDIRDLNKTVEALAQAGLTRLPHDEMIVEIPAKEFNADGISKGCLHFQWVAAHNVWRVEYLALYEDKLYTFPKVICIGIAARKDMTAADIVQLNDPSLKYGYIITGDVIDATGTHVFSNFIAYSLALTLTLMCTRGAVKEATTKADLAKLNKARAKKGRAPVPEYTVIKIGHTYNSDGSRTAHVEGISKRPHWRRGHLRNQRFGPNLAETKQIFIEPVFINLAEGLAPTHIPKLIKV